MRRDGIFVLLLVLLTSLTGCVPKEKTPLVVFAAGSLIKPFDDLEKAFEAKYPDIDVQSEYHGSIQVMRHATELHEKIDVVATADQALIPLLMYQVNDPDTGKPYASWYLRFATNRLGVAYTAQSKYADEINAENWAEILARPDVRIGIADPRFDASGYRALMVFKLAEDYNGVKDLFSRMFDGQFRYPLKVNEGGGMSIIRVPEILESTSGAHVVIRGASMELLALLESGDLDYAFEYESVIQQHNLKLVALPDELNLGDAAQNEQYGRVTVVLDFKRFASVKPEFTGEQIGYGITIPSNAPHAKEAEQYIAFLFSPEGRKLMEQDHHPMFDPAIVDGYENLPQSLKGLAPAP
jgi:molybdate/tungstate transport system substrate-binding protein